MPYNFPFPQSQKYTAVAIAYQNNKLIADMALPQAPVPAQLFYYTKRTQSEAYTVPPTLVGRRGAVNQLSFTYSNASASTSDYALEDPIPQADIEEAQNSGIPSLADPVGMSTEYLMNLILLDREVRVAATVFNTANYTYTATLSGTSQYSDYTNSDPVAGLLGYLDIPLMRPNVMIIGRDAWRVLRQHPKLVNAIKQSGSGGVTATGTVATQQVADLLEIDQVIVGEGWVNTAKRGLTPSYSRVWGKHIALQYRDNVMDVKRGTSWGFQGVLGTPIAGQISDPNIGMRGGIKNRVGMATAEVVAAPDLGYYIQNAVG